MQQIDFHRTEPSFCAADLSSECAARGTERPPVMPLPQRSLKITLGHPRISQRLLVLANIDRASRGSRRLRFRHGQREHTIVKLCQGVIGVGVFRHGNRAHEASIGAL